MKRILSMLIILVFCISFAFSFVGCGDIFAGNYQSINKERFVALFNNMSFTGFESFTDGFDISMQIKCGKYFEQYYKLTLKYNIKKNQMSAKIIIDNGYTDTETECYLDGIYFYEKTIDNKTNEVKTRKMRDTYGEYISDLLYQNFISNISLFQIGFLEDTRFFADFSNGAKIMVVVNDKDEKTQNLGEVYYVFDNNKSLKGIKGNVFMYEDENINIINYKIIEYKGKVNIPKKAYSWNLFN